MEFKYIYIYTRFYRSIYAKFIQKKKKKIEEKADKRNCSKGHRFHFLLPFAFLYNCLYHRFMIQLKQIDKHSI